MGEAGDTEMPGRQRDPGLGLGAAWGEGAPPHRAEQGSPPGEPRCRVGGGEGRPRGHSLYFLQ